eukprot:TRINITY_DN1428_c3_g1_i1.p1 TRINITY_DN1428_c3_g1~~TRINITY_DN1428_c3_g1_i1.p1  ORF type:complete len:444 (+),score=82.83 TRINITY_DN1428_c3_g1_i1:212-1543(+)
METFLEKLRALADSGSIPSSPLMIAPDPTTPSVFRSIFRFLKGVSEVPAVRTVASMGLFIMGQCFVAYWTVGLFKKMLQPGEDMVHLQEQRVSEYLTRRRGAPVDVQLTPMEAKLVPALISVSPSVESTRFSDIGGLEDVKEELRRSVILPVTMSHMFKDKSLLRPPSGVLLHGPPGTGKTLLARALASQTSFSFINVSPSTIMSKWLGDSEKVVHAIFSLARKLQPSIIFVDEMDVIFSARGAHEHEATSRVKGEFLALWDGMSTNSAGTQVIVFGCTNRPHVLDPAVKRRMGRQFFIGLPDQASRKAILDILLHNENSDDLDLDRLAHLMNGYSGSDIAQVCKTAASLVLRDVDWTILSTPAPPSPSSPSSPSSSARSSSQQPKDELESHYLQQHQHVQDEQQRRCENMKLRDVGMRDFEAAITQWETQKKEQRINHNLTR